MVPLVGVVSIAVWGCDWWLVLVSRRGLGGSSSPSLKEHLGNALFSAQWTDS